MMHQKKIISEVVGIVAMVAGLAATVAVTQFSQDIRQKAASLPTVSLNFSANTINLSPNQAGTTNIMVNAGTSPITGINLKINLNPNSATNPQLILANDKFRFLVNPSLNSGVLSAVIGVICNQTTCNTPTGNFQIATLNFTASTQASTSNLTLVGSQVTSTLANQYLSPSLNTSTITIATNITSTPNPTSIPATAPTTSSINLNNTSFESGLTNWAYSGILNTNNTYSHQGNNSFILTTGYNSQNIASLLQANTPYTFTAWYRVTTAGTTWGSPRLRLSKYVDLGSSDYGEASGQKAVNSGWSQLTLTKSFTSSELSSPIYFGMRSFGFNGTAYIDDFGISNSSIPTNSPVPSTTPSTSPTLTTSPSATPVPSVTSAPASTATPIPSGNSNIISNPSFESGDANWTNASCTSSTDAHQGSNSFILTTGHLSQNIVSKLIAGTPYTFTGWVKLTTAGTSWGSPRLRLSKYADLGTSDYGDAAAANTPSSGWQQLSITKTFTASELSGNVYFGFRSFGFNGTAVVDDVQVR